MVFPLAKDDLRRYMSTEPPIGFGKYYLCWLLKQIHGIAEALSKIHEFEDFEDSSNTLAPREQRQIGLHTDLKPENLLLISDADDDRSTHGTIKIADFGQASLRSIKNGSKTRTILGTPPYTAPEVEKPQSERMISRPFDIWSLACIYMELLVWLAFGKDGSEEFQTLRFVTANAVYKGNEFYVRDDHNVCYLNPRVEKTVQKLRGILSRETCLLQVLDIIYKEMFIINPDDRIKAKKLAEDLNLILETARSEPEQKHNFRSSSDLLTAIPIVATNLTKSPSPMMRIPIYQQEISYQPDIEPVGEPISAQDNPIIEVTGDSD